MSKTFDHLLLAQVTVPPFLKAVLSLASFSLVAGRIPLSRSNNN